MPQYSCERCNYTTSKLSNIVSHVNRKSVCTVSNIDIPIEKLRRKYAPSVDEVRIVKCDKCNKVFSCKSSLTFHKRKCGPMEVSNHDVKIMMESLMKAIHDMHENIIQHITSSINNAMSNNTGTMNNNTNSNNTTTTTRSTTINTPNASTVNNISITYQDFGEENKDYITSEFAKKCFEMGENGIMSMLNMIFFNADHSENHNVRMKSLKNQLVDVFSNEEWVTKGFNDTVKKMIKASSDEIMKELIPSMSGEANPIVMNGVAEITCSSNEAKKNIRNLTKASLVERQKKASSLE